MYDLQIHPRDRELIAATHGRSFWIVDINPLEQMAGNSRVMASATHLFAPRVAYDYGETANMGEPCMASATRPSSSRTRRTAPRSRTASARARHRPLVVMARGGGAGSRWTGWRTAGARSSSRTPLGDTVAVVNGPATPGLHKVYWNFRGRATPVRVALGPSQLRDSTNVARRITFIFDSVGRTGTVPQASLDRMKNALLSGQVARGWRSWRRRWRRWRRWTWRCGTRPAGSIARVKAPKSLAAVVAPQVVAVVAVARRCCRSVRRVPWRR